FAEAGYENVMFFENAKDGREHLHALTENETVNVEDEVNLIITDIEMPQMDGHHLKDNIKKDEILSDIPVIISSSLITDDIYHKRIHVGASAQVSKPEIVKLVEEIDRLII